MVTPALSVGAAQICHQYHMAAQQEKFPQILDTVKHFHILEIYRIIYTYNLVSQDELPYWCK